MISTPFDVKLSVAFPLKKAFGKLVLGLAALLFVAGLFVTAPAAQAAEIETLHGVSLTEKDCTIVVTSTGCTRKEDFVALLKKSDPPIVTFVRLKPDFCKAAARPYPIKFSFEEIGAKKFDVANLFVPSPRYY